MPREPIEDVLDPVREAAAYRIEFSYQRPYKHLARNRPGTSNSA